MLISFSGFSSGSETKQLEKVALIKQGEDAIEIHLNKDKTQGYMYISIKSEDKKTKYWKINLAYYDGGVILLGKVPEDRQKKRGGGTVKISQSIPQGVPVFPLNQKLILNVGYRKDMGGHPGATYTALSFELDNDGKLKEISKEDDKIKKVLTKPNQPIKRQQKCRTNRSSQPPTAYFLPSFPLITPSTFSSTLALP